MAFYNTEPDFKHGDQLKVAFYLLILARQTPLQRPHCGVT